MRHGLTAPVSYVLKFVAATVISSPRADHGSNGEATGAHEPLLRPGATALHHQLYRALQELDAAGLVERRQGRGTFVLDPGRPSLTLNDALDKAHRETVVRVVEVAQRRPSADVRAALQLPDDAELLYVLRVPSDESRPLIVSEAWLPADLVDVVTPDALQRKPLYQLLDRPGPIIQEVSAEVADPCCPPSAAVSSWTSPPMRSTPPGAASSPTTCSRLGEVGPDAGAHLRVGLGRPTQEAQPMYIGVGAIVLILVILLLVRVL